MIAAAVVDAIVAVNAADVVNAMIKNVMISAVIVNWLFWQFSLLEFFSVPRNIKIAADIN